MFSFQWKALRVGDHVLVHDDTAAALDLDDGVVELVEMRPGRENDVAIRLSSTGAITRPRRHAVHMAPLDGRDSCWRCDEIAARATSAVRPTVAA